MLLAFKTNFLPHSETMGNLCTGKQIAAAGPNQNRTEERNGKLKYYCITVSTGGDQ